MWHRKTSNRISTRSFTFAVAFWWLVAQAHVCDCSFRAGPRVQLRKSFERVVGGWMDGSVLLGSIAFNSSIQGHKYRQQGLLALFNDTELLGGENQNATSGVDVDPVTANERYLQYIRDASALVLFSIAANALIISSICSSSPSSSSYSYFQYKSSAQKGRASLWGSSSSADTHSSTDESVSNKQLRSALRQARKHKQNENLHSEKIRGSSTGATVLSPSHRVHKKQVSFQNADIESDQAAQGGPTNLPMQTVQEISNKAQATGRCIFQGCVDRSMMHIVHNTPSRKYSPGADTHDQACVTMTHSHNDSNQTYQWMTGMEKSSNICDRGSRHVSSGSGSNAPMIYNLLLMACLADEGGGSLSTMCSAAAAAMHPQRPTGAAAVLGCALDGDAERQSILMSSARTEGFFEHLGQ
jgi:hypothetical protein